MSNILSVTYLSMTLIIALALWYLPYGPASHSTPDKTDHGSHDTNRLLEVVAEDGLDSEESLELADLSILQKVRQRKNDKQADRRMTEYQRRENARTQTRSESLLAERHEAVRAQINQLSSIPEDGKIAPGSVQYLELQRLRALLNDQE